MKANNKTIVVTGAGSGMGREIALLLISKGANVIGVDINEAALNETKEKAGDKKDYMLGFVVNIADKAAVEGFSKDAIARYGNIDGVVNNAGIIQPFVKVNELSYDLMERVMNINFYGTLYMTKAFLPHLLTRPEAHIVNISSMGGFLPVPGQTIYGASKAAVKLLTEGLHSELSGTNVKVTVVFPGGVATGIMTNSGLKMPEASATKSKASKVLTAANAAQIIVDGMENNKFRVLVGPDARFMDKFYRLNPKAAAGMIAEKMKALLSAH
jgi:short-subunit dehydrogenase